MARSYPHVAIPDADIPQVSSPWTQLLLDTYASEINKVCAVWRAFGDSDLGYRPHERSSTVEAVLKHQLLSERRFFAEFLGLPEPAPTEVLPAEGSVQHYADRLVALARPRLGALASKPDAWWSDQVPFFDVSRPRLWVFWRRVLHTAHHRTQLTVYLRLLDRPVPAVYGPSADESWAGADPTASAAAAGRTGRGGIPGPTV